MWNLKSTKLRKDCFISCIFAFELKTDSKILFISLSIYILDAEGSVLKEKLDGMESSRELIGDGYEKASKEATIATIEVNFV